MLWGVFWASDWLRFGADMISYPESWHAAEKAKCAKATPMSLRYIIADCRSALAAMPDNPKAGQYMDTIHYCYAELKKRE